MEYLDSIKIFRSNPEPKFVDRRRQLFGLNEPEIPTSQTSSDSTGTSRYSEVFHRFQMEMGLAKNIIAIYDNFVEKLLYRLRRERFFNGNKIKLVNLRVSPTEKTALEALDSGQTYSCKIVAEAWVLKDGEWKILNNDCVVYHLPLMKGSKFCGVTAGSDDVNFENGECYRDPLGYFVISGNEKVIIGREHLVKNQPICYVASDDKLNCRFLMDLKGGSRNFSMVLEPNGNITATIQSYSPSASVENLRLPVGNLLLIVFYLLEGEESNFVSIEDVNSSMDMMWKFIPSNESLKVKMSLFPMISYTMQDVRSQLGVSAELTRGDFMSNATGHRNAKDLRQYMMFNLLPHVGDLESKLNELGRLIIHMARTMAEKRAHDNRDSWINNRLETAGKVIEDHINTNWNNMIEGANKKLSTNASKTFSFALSSIVNPLSIFDTNAQASQSKTLEETRSIDFLHRDTPMAIHSQIRKITSKATTRSKQPYIRQIHASQLGYVCVAETPEGINCGLVKNQGCTNWISLDRGDVDEMILNIVNERFLQHIPKDREQAAPLIVNGVTLGFVNPLEIYPELWTGLKTNPLTFDVTIVYCPEEYGISIYSDGSRMTRPLFTVNHETQKLNFNGDSNRSIMDMVQSGEIEFISASEINNKYFFGGEFVDLLYHQDPSRVEGANFTHSEIEPQALLGVAGSCIPLANHNQGPRVSYQCGMSKQALSTYHSNYQKRPDVGFKRLIGATRPLGETNMSGPTGLSDQPSGDTAIVAILVDPVNNEDAIVFNQRFLDHHFLVEKYINIKEQLSIRKENHSYDPRTSRPELFHALDKSTGLPMVGSLIRHGDAIMSISRNGTFAPIFAGVDQEGYVASVSVPMTTGVRTISIKLIQTRRQVCGDKFASRYSQKGTVGSVRHPSLLPRIMAGPNAGLIPDILFNPHSIPSRMTQGKVIEMLMSKAALYDGSRVNLTSFTSPNIYGAMLSLSRAGFGDYSNIKDKDGKPLKSYEDQRKAMEALSIMVVEEPQDQHTVKDIYEELTGKESMVNFDGRPFEVKVFICPCYYQSLRHHAYDKFQVRDFGSTDHLTHQPVRGKTHGGGLKYGEMERDATLSHGASGVIKDRLMESSDKHPFVYCRKCQTMAVSDFTIDGTSCPMCELTAAGNPENFVRLDTPWVTLLIIRMLNTIGIQTRFELSTQSP